MDIYEGEADPQSIEYEPIGVKDLLIAMKDSSELIIDLAYSAILTTNEKLAEEVLELEAQMDVLQLQARMNMLLAARTTEDAKQLAPVLGMIGAAEKISEAAGDIAHVVLGEDELPGIRSALPEAMEVLAKTTVDPDSTYAGHTLGKLNLETETGVRVIAVRGKGDWTLNPDRDTRLNAGDVVLLRGGEDNLTSVYETLSGEEYEFPAETETDVPDLARAVDTIILMKNVSELSVDLAYASVLFDDDELAEEVHDLEVEVDALQARLEAWTLKAASEVEDPVNLRGLLRLANSTELISDAALEISEGILRDIQTHPVIAESVKESDVAVRRVKVGPASPFGNESVETLRKRHPGVSIIAIHHSDDEWSFYPAAAEQITADDILIVRGTWDATSGLIESASAG